MENNENRTHQMKFRVTDEERCFIEKKSEISACKNVSAYLRNMAITGMIINYDMNEFKQINRSLVGIQTNINQIALRVNSTNNVYAEDVEEIREKVNNIWLALTSIQSALQLEKQ